MGVGKDATKLHTSCLAPENISKVPELLVAYDTELEILGQCLRCLISRVGFHGFFLTESEQLICDK